MPYGETDLMGIGSYVGEIREAPDGQLYEWVEGVDGLGNPLGWGFWKKLKRAAGGLLRKALPFAKFIPGFSLARRALKFASPLLRRVAPLAKFIPGYGPAIYAGAKLAQRAGLFGVGEVAEGSDGQLYEVVEGLGEDGRPRRMFRRVSLCLPATLRSRGRAGMRPPMAAPTAAAPATARPFRRFR